MAKINPSLQEIHPDKINSNPDNPRLIFRENEMNDLLESIREVGIKVPITVYEDGAKFYLIDGERRWRCARKLNLRCIPAIIQPKPSKLENLLMMFNIHNVRVDWDLMPMALKLGEIRNMLERAGQSTNPKRLASITAVSLPTIRRALDLLELPAKYQRMLLREAEKPRDQQEVTVDLFVEINKSRNVIERYKPDVFKSVTKSQYVDSMVTKYTGGIVKNVVRFRDISKIARAERAGGSESAVTPILVRLVTDLEYSIEEAYRDTVEKTYQLRDLTTKALALVELLSKYRNAESMSNELKSHLRRLRDEINRLLGDS